MACRRCTDLPAVPVSLGARTKVGESGSFSASFTLASPLTTSSDYPFSIVQRKEEGRESESSGDGGDPSKRALQRSIAALWSAALRA